MQRMECKLATKTAVQKQTVPDFIQKIQADYKGQISHTFILHGNIYDFCDNGTGDLGIQAVLASCFDSNIQTALSNKPQDEGDSGLTTGDKAAPNARIVAFYNGRELDFPSQASEEQFVQAFQSVLSEDEIEKLGPDFQKCTRSTEHTFRVLNTYFRVSKTLNKQNLTARRQNGILSMEPRLTLVFTNADSMFPDGYLANLSSDRSAITTMRDWAQDLWVGDRNRIILLTRHLEDIHISIRSELARAHSVRKPTKEDRIEWMKNFDKTVKQKIALTGKPLTIENNTNVTGILFAEDFSLEMAGIQSAGMNRRQLKDAIMSAWRTGQPLDSLIIRTRKKEALDTEYNGLVDIKEGESGFEEIGGHEHFKQYCQDNIITPLKEGDKRGCSRGVLLPGPPGTGKTMAAWALAKEAGLNFLIVDVGKVFGGLVGETEKNVRKLIEAIEAAAPCIVFLDELDTVLASGRSGGGDSGTSARVMSSLMTWLSDPSRKGRVVVVAATNRPDLLDEALIRQGRLDAILPMLPPQMQDALGRWNIVAALTKKHKFVFSEELKKTRGGLVGLGMLLNDTRRIWTGAEIEAVLEHAFRKARKAKRLVDGKPSSQIHVEDFEGSMRAIIPNTGAVQTQITLALRFSNNRDYIPADWLAEADKQIAIRAQEKADTDDMAA